MAHGDDETRDEGRSTPLGELATRVGNELNNPLAAVLSAHQYLRARLVGQPGATDDPRITHFFDIVERELGTMTRVVDDLRAFGSSRPLARSTFLLRDLIEDVLAEVRRPRGIELDNRAAEALAPVHLDRDACRRLLVQLVRNAVEAHDADAEGTVTIDARLEADQVVFEVSDRGGGIAPDAQPRILEPLFGTKAKGTGLGLTIVDALVRAHGGTMTFETAVGQGTTFTVRLPAR